MLTSRFSNVLVVTALLVIGAMLIFQGVATSGVAATALGPAHDARAGAVAHAACAFSADDIRSMHAVFVSGPGIWLVRTRDGFAGVDGGSLEILRCPPQSGSRSIGFGDLRRYEASQEAKAAHGALSTSK